MSELKVAPPPMLSGRSLALLIGFWALMVFLFSVQLSIHRLLNGASFDPVMYLAELIDWELYLLLIPVNIWACRRFPLERGSLAKTIPVHFGFSLILSMVSITMSVVWFGLFDSVMGASERAFSWFKPIEYVGRALTMNLLLYWGVATMVHALAFQERYQAGLVRTSQLEAKLAQSQLDVLRMQLNPHFLFNTLHAISALMHSDVDKADRMVTLLSDLLRRSLQVNQAQEVRLRDELEFLSRYLEIEQVRFEDRLTIYQEIDPGSLEILVPSLLLQPLVENALRHGLAPRAAPGKIWIRSEVRDGLLHLTVEDDGVGVERSRLDHLERGVGLGSTTARLEQLYGQNHQVELKHRQGGGLVVHLKFPARVR